MGLRWLCKKQVRSLSCRGRSGRVVWGVPSVPACATSLVKDWHLALASTACGASRPGSAVVTLVLGPAGLSLWGSRGTQLCHQPRAGCVPTLAMRGCVNRSWEINGCKPGPGPRAWIKIKHCEVGMWQCPSRGNWEHWEGCGSWASSPPALASSSQVNQH